MTAVDTDLPDVGGIHKGRNGLGLFDVCPQRRRPVLTHMGVRADVE